METGLSNRNELANEVFFYLELGFLLVQKTLQVQKGKTGFMNKLTMLVALHHLGYHDQVKRELDRLVAFSPLQDGLRQLIAGHNERGLDIFRQLGYW